MSRLGSRSWVDIDEPLGGDVTEKVARSEACLRRQVWGDFNNNGVGETTTFFFEKERGRVSDFNFILGLNVS